MLVYLILAISVFFTPNVDLIEELSKVCLKCGTNLDVNAKKCPNCAAKTLKKQQSSNQIFFGITVCVILLFTSFSKGFQTMNGIISAYIIVILLAIINLIISISFYIKVKSLSKKPIYSQNAAAKTTYPNYNHTSVSTSAPSISYQPAQTKQPQAAVKQFCSGCGAKLDSDSKFCEICGKPV